LCANGLCAASQWCSVPFTVDEKAAILSASLKSFGMDESKKRAFQNYFTSS